MVPAMTPLVPSVVGDGDASLEVEGLCDEELALKVLACEGERRIWKPELRSSWALLEDCAAMTPLVRFVVGDGDEALEVMALGDEELALKVLGGEGGRRIASGTSADSG
jgi:hypothetical protein